jgi:hypothetical protein
MRLFGYSYSKLYLLETGQEVIAQWLLYFNKALQTKHLTGDERAGVVVSHARSRVFVPGWRSQCR